MSGCFESVQWNACVHTEKNLLRGGSNPRRCIKQDSEPNTPPTSYSGPCLAADYSLSSNGARGGGGGGGGGVRLLLLFVLTLVCRQTRGHKEMFAKELEVFGHYLIFDTWVWRFTGVKSKIITIALHLMLICRRTSVSHPSMRPVQVCSGAGITETDHRQVTTVFTVQPSFHHRHSTNRVL